MPEFNIVCTYCGKNLLDEDISPAKGTKEGICDSCLTYHFPHTAELIREILEIDKFEGIYKGGGH